MVVLHLLTLWPLWSDLSAYMDKASLLNLWQERAVAPLAVEILFGAVPDT